jgi:putative toxin-antitoxin system antitoxin component (TIGR02293 family)
MPDMIEHETSPTEAVEVARVARLLGLSSQLRNPLEVHDLLRQGLPTRALRHLIDNLKILELQNTSLEKAVGMSLRTYQRRNKTPAKPLNKLQTDKTWKFAEILAKATEVFGSQEEAEQWLQRPAIGLNQRRPIDLLETPAGLELVEDYLERLEYGVYV